MTQGFVFGQPVLRSGLVSQIVRDNFDAVGSWHEGPTAPLNPRLGMPWLDTSQSPLSFTLKFFDGTAFQIIATFPFIAATTGIVRFVINPAVQVWNLLHNLGKPSVAVALYDLSGNAVVALDVDVSNANQVDVTHAVPIAGLAMVIG